MFIVFEGIDGSGKTTVSNMVADALKKRGIAINHIREGGEFASPLVGRMREFGKDSRNLSLLPLPEFLMYVARDAQLIGECIAPAIADGGVVFADRYLYSYEVLGHYGRGLELTQVRPIIDAVASGVWPDLVVLMDVDPHVARARRRVSKLEDKAAGTPGGGGGSRKGLGGIGMMHRLRQGYLRLAERESDRWLVINNSETELEVVVERVTEAIFSLHEKMSTAAEVVVVNESRTAAAPANKLSSLQEARSAFYDSIGSRREKEPKVAAYFLAGLVDPEAHRWRIKLADEAPNVVAYGLRALADDGAWKLREQLRAVAPRFVAKSLAGAAVEGERCDAMRREFLDDLPLVILDTLAGADSDLAWELRDNLGEAEPLAVLSSLRRLDGERAWELRHKFIPTMGDEETPQNLSKVKALLASIRGLADDESWRIRERYADYAPANVLRSLNDLDSERSWRWREKFAALAPKIVLRSFDGQDNPSAWSMRQEFASRAKEALDSMQGLDCKQAWTMRDELVHVWPSTVAKSLGALAATPRGLKLFLQLLDLYPQNQSLLKHATQAAAGQATGGAARRYESGGHPQSTK